MLGSLWNTGQVWGEEWRGEGVVGKGVRAGRIGMESEERGGEGESWAGDVR